MRFTKTLLGTPELEGEEVLYPVPLKTQVSKAVQDIGADVSVKSGAMLRELLPEDVLADPKKVSDAERFMYDNFGLSLDFNEDRYIGGARGC